MSTKTANYNFEKPSAEDFYDIEIFNANSDAADAAIFAASSAAQSAAARAEEIAAAAPHTYSPALIASQSGVKELRASDALGVAFTSLALCALTSESGEKNADTRSPSILSDVQNPLIGSAQLTGITLRGTTSAYCDSVEFDGRGWSLIRRCGKYVYSPSDTIDFIAVTQNGLYSSIRISNAVQNARLGQYKNLSNYLPWNYSAASANSSNSGGGCICAGNSSVYLKPPVSWGTSAQDIKNTLDTLIEPLTLIYPLNTPIKSAITDEALLCALAPYEKPDAPDFSITAGEGCTLSAVYCRDINRVIAGIELLISALAAN